MIWFAFISGVMHELNIFRHLLTHGLHSTCFMKAKQVKLKYVLGLSTNMWIVPDLETVRQILGHFRGNFQSGHGT